MKTLTEFAGFQLKNASKIKQDLVAAGKTAEELLQAMGEALKLEGDRLALLMTVLDTIGEKWNDLKRVIAFSVGEGEKAPHGTIQKENHTFTIEYFPSMKDPNAKNARGQDDGRGDGRRGGRKNEKANDKKRGRGGPGRGRDDQKGPRREFKGPGASDSAQMKPRVGAPASTTKIVAPLAAPKDKS